MALESLVMKEYLDLVALTLEVYAVMLEEKGVVAFQHLIQASLVQQEGTDGSLGA